MQQKLQNQEIKRIFSFGTLQKGHDYVDWNKLVHNEKFNPKCTKATLKNYQIYMADNPLMLPKENSYVQGEILEVEDHLWQEFIDVCDKIEGYPDWYRKEILQVEIQNNSNNEKPQIVDAIVYFMNEKHYNKDKIKIVNSTQLTREFYLENQKQYLDQTSANN